MQDVRENEYRSRQSDRSPLVMWAGLGDRADRGPTVSDNMYSVVLVRGDQSTELNQSPS